MRTKLSLPVVLAVCLLLGLLGLLAGCESARDGVASAIGAPTAADVARLKSDADAAKADAAKLKALADQSTKAAAEREKAAADAASRADAIRKAIAEASGRLAGASGDVFDALSQSIDRLRAALKQAQDQHAANAALAADLIEQAAKLDAAAADADRDIAAANAKLDAAAAATDEAIAGATGAIRTLGAAVGQYVPGAGIAANQVADHAQTALSLLLGAGAVGAYLKARKNGKIAGETAADLDGLVEVVAVNEKLCLIKDDPALKKQARDALSANARAALAKAKEAA